MVESGLPAVYSEWARNMAPYRCLIIIVIITSITVCHLLSPKGAIHAIVFRSVCQVQSHSLPKVTVQRAHLYVLGPLTYQSTDQTISCRKIF